MKLRLGMSLSAPQGGPAHEARTSYRLEGLFTGDRGANLWIFALSGLFSFLL